MDDHFSDDCQPCIDTTACAGFGVSWRRGQAITWQIPAASTDLSLLLTLFSPLLPDFLLLLGSEHERHGWGRGLSHRGCKGYRMLHVYCDLVLIDIPMQAELVRSEHA